MASLDIETLEMMEAVKSAIREWVRDTRMELWMGGMNEGTGVEPEPVDETLREAIAKHFRG